jgi:hypothetical protein
MMGHLVIPGARVTYMAADCDKGLIVMYHPSMPAEIRALLELKYAKGNGGKRIDMRISGLILGLALAQTNDPYTQFVIQKAHAGIDDNMSKKSIKWWQLIDDRICLVYFLLLWMMNVCNKTFSCMPAHTGGCQNELQIGADLSLHVRGESQKANGLWNAVFTIYSRSAPDKIVGVLTFQERELQEASKKRYTKTYGLHFDSSRVGLKWFLDYPGVPDLAGKSITMRIRNDGSKTFYCRSRKEDEDRLNELFIIGDENEKSVSAE